MPIYEYRCQKCGAKTEALQKLGAGEKGLICQACGSEDLKKIRSLSLFPYSYINRFQLIIAQ